MKPAPDTTETTETSETSETSISYRRRRAELLVSGARWRCIVHAHGIVHGMT